MNKIKVSIIIPVYNSEKFLRQCLDSVVYQTLKEIEIICVNDGSSDSSLAIMKEYAEKDSRVKIIDKVNSGYGHSMNCGLDAAVGEYIGIIESDDYADLDMFETLYERAKLYGLDVVKSSYYMYYSKPVVISEKIKLAPEALCKRTFCPRTGFSTKKEKLAFFNFKPTIWSAIYKKEFLRENNIRFNETPGASYQDASFNFKVWACAERVQLIQDAFLHYRQDNELSSIHVKGKVFSVCDEYAEMERFLNERSELKNELECLKNCMKYDTYMWNYNRLGVEYKQSFIERATAEFKVDMENGVFDKEYFKAYKWYDLNKLINNSRACHTEMRVVKIPFQKILRVPMKLYSGYQCYKENGLIFTLKRVKQKILSRVN